MTCNVVPYYTWIVWTQVQPVKYDYDYICNILSAVFTVFGMHVWRSSIVTHVKI